MPAAEPSRATGVYAVVATGPLTTLELRIRLTPKSNRDAVEGITTTADGPALKARVRAVPENHAANIALIALIGTWLGIPKTSITLKSGGKSRIKVLTVAAPPADIDRAIALIGQLSL